MLWSNTMNLNDRYIRMSDLANQPAFESRTYTTKSGQIRTISARPASRGIIGLSSKHIYHLINQKKFPSPVKVGRASLWRLSEINQWLDSHAKQTDG